MSALSYLYATQLYT
uniref:ARF guanine-nucleotide exchange factor GNOM-like n=1 Tax=Rhizophora mucronata TaxID=61149 RepID=A0A2P2KJG4_RHIMU